jgi:two-component system nitrogen regulation sensor histidine kinase NtrY
MWYSKPLKFLSRLTLSRNAAVFLTIAAVASGIATYLVLTHRSTDINTVYWLLNLDLVLLLLLGTIIARQVAKLWSERRRGAAGSRLHVRLVVVFGFLAAAPAILMAIFSAVFFYFGVQAWFNDRVSTAVNESLEVAQAYLREHQQVMRADVLAMANDLDREAPGLVGNPDVFNQVMQTQSMLRNLPEAIVVHSDGKVIARAPLSLSLELEGVMQKDIVHAAAGEVVLMTGDAHDRIRALVRLDRFFDSYLYVGRLVDANVLMHMQTAETAVREYTTLQGRHSQLQVSITAMFMAVALLLLLAAVWFGLTFAEQLVVPIGALITAAERVRMGDLSVRVAAASNNDEFGLLGAAFNRMTNQIEAQQAELMEANAMLDERRRFTEAVLAGTSSGVVGLDGAGFVTLANTRAAFLLQGDQLESPVGRKLTDFVPEMETIMESAEGPAPLQMEYAFGEGPRRTLLIRVTREQSDAGESSGAVVTIDDISALVSAQRKAAWADVARRIAHEIKNPLTPIQLAAERLKRKYLPQIHDDPETFEKCTDTIIRQVNDIGHMVNEFSAYARMPVPIKRMENLVEVCQDALVLQKQAHPDIEFGFISSEPAMESKIDRSQFTQVITNLLQNAIDSIHERRQQDERYTDGGQIKILLDCRGGNIVVTVEDDGGGLPEKIKEHLLEPYVTTRKKGSGLGLAIVKKIMEDHDGSVVLENNTHQDVKSGAKAVIVFPKDTQT